MELFPAECALHVALKDSV